MGVQRQLRTGVRGQYRKIVGGVEPSVENCRITAGVDFWQTEETYQFGLQLIEMKEVRGLGLEPRTN